jgi:hypothetical protein
MLIILSQGDFRAWENCSHIRPEFNRELGISVPGKIEVKPQVTDSLFQCSWIIAININRGAKLLLHGELLKRSDVLLRATLFILIMR